MSEKTLYLIMIGSPVSLWLLINGVGEKRKQENQFKPLCIKAFEKQCYIQQALLVLNLLKRVILFCLPSAVHEYSITLTMANN